jgi:hypothetical protein
VCHSDAQVAVVGSIARHLKEHQWDGLRFLWKCCVTDHAVRCCHHNPCMNMILSISLMPPARRHYAASSTLCSLHP